MQRVKPTEWEPWLKSFPWFIPGEERLAENFPHVVEQLLTPATFRRRILLELTTHNGVSEGYRQLSDLMLRGLIQTVLTTNFDTCLLDALRERQPHIREIHEVNRTQGDYDDFDVYHRCQIVWLHGRAENYSDKNLLGEVASLDSKLLDLLRPLLRSPIVVIGYRGAEPSIMEGLLGQQGHGRLDFPNGIYWCVRGQEAPHPNVEALARRVGSNFKFVSIDGFDEVLGMLANALVGEDYYPQAGPIASRTTSGFDEQVAEGVPIEALDLDLALSVLRTYCEKLGRAPVTHGTLRALLYELGLVIQSDADDKVTNGAVLLFGKQAQDIFPHAVVSITESGKRREIFEGNLISQHRALMDRLDSLEVNPNLKLKMRRVHEEQRAYPPRALVELLVNLLVHRDYSKDEPANIDISHGAEITFTNPGALSSKVAGQLTLERDGRFVPTGALSDQRNTSLCDVFFGISAMERAGTGLTDVSELMQQSGGGCAFFSHDGQGMFEARLSQPASSNAGAQVARSQVPTGLYIFNVLPFASIPDYVSVLRLHTPLRERPLGLNLSQSGTFLDQGKELWSFVPLAELIHHLQPVCDVEASCTVSRKDLEVVPESKRLITWLIRKHWDRHLESLSKQGLILEPGRKKRAYFEAEERCARAIIWNGQRRGNRRDVVKKRAEGAGAWFENEGFGYEVVDFDGTWCIRIKPFYMFTGQDGRTPLPSFRTLGKATRRIKFDRNKNVEADLLFWGAFLGLGKQTINIGQLHVDDLILDSSFLTVEIPERGLITYDAYNHRVSA